MDVLPGEVKSIEYANLNTDSVMMREVSMIHTAKTFEFLQYKGSLTRKG